MAAQNARPDPALTLPESRIPYLAEILEAAMKQSPQMLARSIELAKADGYKLMDGAIRWPSVNLNSSYGMSAVSATNGGTSTSNGFLYDIGVSQPVFRWGDISATVEISELRKKVAEKNYAESYRDLAVLLRARFMQLVVRKYAVKCRKLVLSNAERIHAVNLERAEHGAIAAGDVDLSALSLSESRVSLRKEELEFEQLKRAFCRLSGLKELPDEKIPEKLLEPRQVEGQAERLALYFDQTDQIKSTPIALRNRYEIRQSELRYKIAGNRLMPKFDLSAGIRQENTTSIGQAGASQTVTKRQNVAFAANWALFDGFASRGAKRVALAERREAESRLSDYFAELNDQTRNVVAQYDLAVSSMALSEKRLAMATGSFGYAETEAKAGRVASSDLERFRVAMMESEIAAMNGRMEVYARWSDLVALLWLDPALTNLPPSYLKHGN